MCMQPFLFPRLQQALEELRTVYDKQMQQNRDDFAKLYDDRVSNIHCIIERSFYRACHYGYGITQPFLILERLYSTLPLINLTVLILSYSSATSSPSSLPSAAPTPHPCRS